MLFSWLTRENKSKFSRCVVKTDLALLSFLIIPDPGTLTDQIIEFAFDLPSPMIVGLPCLPSAINSIQVIKNDDRSSTHFHN